MNENIYQLVIEILDLIIEKDFNASAIKESMKHGQENDIPIYTILRKLMDGTIDDYFNPQR